MMPMMQFGRADKQAKWPDGETHIGMNVDGPQPTKRQQPGKGFKGKSHDEGRQIDQAHGINRVGGMFAVGGEPIKMFGAMMDRMEAPKKTDAVLQTMAPVNQ